MKEKLQQQLLLKDLDKTEWRRDQRDAVGWQFMFQKTKQNAIGAASGRTRKSDKPGGDPRNRPPIVWAASEQTRHCSPQAEN